MPKPRRLRKVGEPCYAASTLSIRREMRQALAEYTEVIMKRDTGKLQALTNAAWNVAWVYRNGGGATDRGIMLNAVAELEALIHKQARE
jgi:hypothetical protein